MGLTAFALFVVPWMLLAVWLFSLPSAIRLGAPSAPWRPLASGREWFDEQQRREAIRDQQLHRNNHRDTASAVGSGSVSGIMHEPYVMPDGGALGSLPEHTEPKE